MSLLRPTLRLPHRFVPSAREQFVVSLEGLPVHWLVKYLKRRFVFGVVLPLFGKGKLCKHIEARHRRILWVNLAAPSLGDSLMDLAARTLLVDRDLTLLTDPVNVQLYVNDQYFTAVYSSPIDVRAVSRNRPFDLVICDAYSPRVLLKKVIAAPQVEIVGLYGFLNGFEIHRTYFAFARMIELLALDRINEPIRPTITLPAESKDKQLEVDVCIAIGGEWSFRTYDYWSSVVSWLVAQGYSVSLVGSDNGLRSASEILELEPTIRSTVGALSLPEVVAEIAKARVFVGADGGLWHIACAIPIPSVVLFADCQIFDQEGNRVTRETTDITCETLYNATQVSNIESDSVIEAFKRLSARIGLHAS